VAPATPGARPACRGVRVSPARSRRRQQAEDARLARRQIHRLGRGDAACRRARMVRRRLRCDRPLSRQRRRGSEDGRLAARGAAEREPPGSRRPSRAPANRLGRGDQHVRHGHREPQGLSRVRAAGLQRAAHSDLGPQRDVSAGGGRHRRGRLDTRHPHEQAAEAGCRVSVRADPVPLPQSRRTPSRRPGRVQRGAQRGRRAALGAATRLGHFAHLL